MRWRSLKAALSRTRSWSRNEPQAASFSTGARWRGRHAASGESSSMCCRNSVLPSLDPPPPIPILKALKNLAIGAFALLNAEVTEIVDVFMPPQPEPPIDLTVLQDGVGLRALLIPHRGAVQAALEAGTYELRVLDRPGALADRRRPGCRKPLSGQCNVVGQVIAAELPRHTYVSYGSKAVLRICQRQVRCTFES